MDARFWAKVKQADGCWLWTGAVSDSGYGSLGRNGRALKAHRYAWELTHGPVPAGLDVCHHCDVPLCVRPDHLWLGTRAENTHDRDRKGRQATGQRHGTHTHPESYRGERHGRARLTRTQVREIRARFAAGATKLGLASEFGVSRRLVRSILDGRVWGWLS